MTLIKGKQAQVDFTQKARDAQSQLQNWISEVSAGFTGADVSQTHCTAPANGRPVVQAGAPPTNGTYTPTCVFLGKAVQFPPNGESNIYAYSVFGNNTYNGRLPTNLAESNPEPAVNQAGVETTVTFDLTPLTVKGKKSCQGISGACDTRLLGFYNSINSESITNGNNENELNVYYYPNFNGTPSTSDASGGNSSVTQCIEMANSCTPPILQANGNPPQLQNLKLCITDGDRTAQLSILSSSGLGASVQLDFINC